MKKPLKYIILVFILFLILLGLTLFPGAVYLFSMESFFVKSWRQHWNAKTDLEKLISEDDVDVCQFENGSWVVGVCYDSHNPYWRCVMKEGLIVLHDHTGKTRGFSGHVCGRSGLKRKFHIMLQGFPKEQRSVENVYKIFLDGAYREIEPYEKNKLKQVDSSWTL